MLVWLMEQGGRGPDPVQGFERGPRYKGPPLVYCIFDVTNYTIFKVF